MVSAAKIKADAVNQEADGTWTMQCPVTDGTCGDRAIQLPFRSPGWPTKAYAAERLEQHLDEHRGKGAMQELHDFRVERGLVPSADGLTAVSTTSIEDLS